MGDCGDWTYSIQVTLKRCFYRRKASTASPMFILIAHYAAAAVGFVGVWDDGFVRNGS